MKRRVFCVALMLIAAVAVGGCKDRTPGENSQAGGSETPVVDQPVHDAIDAEHKATALGLINGGIDYLLAHRDDDGGWSMGGGYQPALTAMVVKALVQSPRFDGQSPEVDAALQVLLSHAQTDGGIYIDSEGANTYATSIAVMALAATGRDDLTPAMRDAVDYLRGIQIIPGQESPHDGRTIIEGDPMEGGVSYGQHGRPDLSNVGMWMEALHVAGVPGDDPQMQRALAFVARCQNRSESNPMPWAAEGDQRGGYVYAPALADDLTMGESKAGPGPGGAGLRSYGSMTYAGFKSMLYADVDHDDPRIAAAFQWIRHYWRLDANPNMPTLRSQQGLYYYYHVFAKALRAWDADVITSAPDGVEHNWRHELIDALAERVRDDGSWINEADRWMEGDPTLVTCYALIALQEAIRP